MDCSKIARNRSTTSNNGSPPNIDYGLACRKRSGSMSEAERVRRRPRTEAAITLVSASYGPSEERRLLTGELSSSESAKIPYTRDVIPILRALVTNWYHGEHKNVDSSETEDQGNLTGREYDNNTEQGDLLQIRRRGNGANQNIMSLMEGKSMNTIFGDPCPGTSKKLNVHYVLYESAVKDAVSHAATTEVHRVSFAENERILLRRRVTFYHDDSELRLAVASVSRKVKESTVPSPSAATEQIEKANPGEYQQELEDSEHKIRTLRTMGRSQSIAEFAEEIDEVSASMPSPSLPAAASSQSHSGLKPTPPRKWRLRSAISEIVLPIVLPLLEVRERARCQFVCKVWRFVIKEWGVAQSVDINNSSFPKFTRSFLRGIVAHSYSSLHSLFINDFKELTKDDLHPAIPHLRKLRSLDISRCIQLDDSTLQLLQNISETLEVLYIKGLSKVTDKGLISVCQSCRQLKVLEISELSITDESGVCIGKHLTRLRALYMRDNYLLTNRSIDIITEKCTRLEQLTLWGTTRLRSLSFQELNARGFVGCGKLVLLNLWGCFNLSDDVGTSLSCMGNLRSLIVSECHRLTDKFCFELATHVPQLHHLNLRYCTRVTDEGVRAITNSMENIYSLDLSICTMITSRSLVYLIETRYNTLFELRLQQCGQLDIAAGQFRPHQVDTRGDAGRALVSAIGDENYLCVLDVRNCGGAVPNGGFPTDCPFANGMARLQFEQRIPGFYARAARWNTDVQRRFTDQFISHEL